MVERPDRPAESRSQVRSLRRPTGTAACSPPRRAAVARPAASALAVLARLGDELPRRSATIDVASSPAGRRRRPPLGPGAHLEPAAARCDHRAERLELVLAPSTASPGLRFAYDRAASAAVDVLPLSESASWKPAPPSPAASTRRPAGPATASPLVSAPPSSVADALRSPPSATSRDAAPCVDSEPSSPRREEEHAVSLCPGAAPSRPPLPPAEVGGPRARALRRFSGAQFR